MRRGLSVIVLVANVDAVRNCTGNADCVSQCWQALSAIPRVNASTAGLCMGASCDAHYERCACGDGAVLRADGLCEPTLVVKSCTPVHSAALVMFMATSPELSIEDVRSGNASAALVSILQRSFAAALSQPPELVAMHNVRFTQPAGSDAAAAAAVEDVTSHVTTDLEVDFCIVGPDFHLGGVGNFDILFSVEAQRYAALADGTIRFLRLSLVHETANKETSSNSTNVSIVDHQSSDTIHAHDNGPPLYFFVILGCAVCALSSTLIISCAIVIYLRRKRKRFDVADIDSVPQDCGTCEDGVVSTFIAIAVQGFTLEDVPEDFRPNCLPIQESDLLEVSAGSDGWLYGRLLCDLEQHMGFFPASCVAFVDERLYEAEAPADSVLLCACADHGDSISALEADLTAPVCRDSADSHLRELGSQPVEHVLQACFDEVECHDHLVYMGNLETMPSPRHSGHDNLHCDSQVVCQSSLIGTAFPAQSHTPVSFDVVAGECMRRA